MTNIGTSAFGLRMPIIRQGDSIVTEVLNSMIAAKESGEYTPQENDIIGITESIVARAEGKYVTVDEVVKSLLQLYPNNDHVIVFNPIFSRNRFSIILKAIARYFNSITIYADYIDEVGNELIHPITKVNYSDFYKSICIYENTKFDFKRTSELYDFNITSDVNFLDCTLHPHLPQTYKCDLTGFKAAMEISQYNFYSFTLGDICTNVSEYGLYGSNMMSDELLKLFPDSSSQNIVDTLKEKIQKEFNLKNVDVMIYGDGAYKDPDTGIYELADTVASPCYTANLNQYPAELKLKYLADNEFKDLNGEELKKAIQERIEKKNVQQGTMETQGTTPRKITNLLASLCDLMSGSGDKGTPVVIIQNYFKNYVD